MNQINTNAKNLLAKLLATENISVVHDNVHTASFDVEQRVLRLPQWVGMTNEVYDNLVAHEVGHALFTPAGSASIDDALARINSVANNSVKFDYLNVVEDVRIENLMQRKFPGVAKDFFSGYRWMMNENKFGTEDVDIDTLPLIDRVNIHFKLRGMAQVAFTSEEMDVIDEISDAETWEEAIAATNSLIALAAAEMAEKQDSEQGNTDGAEMPNAMGDEEEGEAQDGNGGGMSEGDEAGDEDGEGGQGGESEGESGEEGDKGDKGEGGNASAPSGEDQDNPSTKTSGEGDTEGQNGKNEGPSQNGTQNGEDSSQIPMSSTQDSLSKSLSDMIDKESLGEDAKPIEYCEIPTAEYVNYKQITLDHSEICEHFDARVRTAYDRDWAWRSWEEFNNDHKKVVAKMVQQFEMKKAAEQSRREETSKTGVLDTLKMVNYRWSEDIFLSNTSIKDGKNHGVVIFVDWSGSMAPNIHETIQQMMILAMFCKKAGIPFEVYAFSSNFAYIDRDTPVGKRVERDDKVRMYDEPGDLRLLNLLSSRAKKEQWTKSLMWCNLLAKSYEARNNRKADRVPGHLMHSIWNLCQTPLNQTMMYSKQIIEDFKSQNGVDIVTPVFMTDGVASDRVLSGNTWGKRGVKYADGTSMIFNTSRHDETSALVQWLSKETGCATIGIDIYPEHCYKTQLYAHGVTDDTKGFLVLGGEDARGFSQKIIIPASKKVTGAMIGDVKQNSNTRTLANAMIRGNRKTAIITNVMTCIVDRISVELH